MGAGVTEPATDAQAPAESGLRGRLMALTGRKYLVTVFLLVAPLVLRCIGLMTESGLLTMWGGISALYLGANVAQKAVAKPDKPKE